MADAPASAAQSPPLQPPPPQPPIPQRKTGGQLKMGCLSGTVLFVVGLVATATVSKSVLLSSLFLIAMLATLAGGVWICFRRRKYLFTGLVVAATAAFLALLGVGAILQSLDLRRERQAEEAQAQRAAEEEKQRLAEFQADPEVVLRDLRTAFEEKRYEAVVSRAAKYLPSGHPELLELHSRAQTAASVEKALTRLKTVESSDHASLAAIYEQLKTLQPENAQYKRKWQFHVKKVEEKRAEQAKLEAQKRVEREREQARQRAAEEKERAEQTKRVAQFGQAPQASPWDGSYAPVKNYLRRIANDPDSIEIDACTKVYHTEEGWLVGCDYRGRNAFGALIRQSNWFTIRHDQVVKMHEASTYKP